MVVPRGTSEALRYVAANVARAITVATLIAVLFMVVYGFVE